MDTRKTSAPSTRVQRGIALHRERGHEIEHVGIGTYRVPSCTGRGSYVVYVSEGYQFCTCDDYPRARALGQRCPHYFAAEVEATKRRAMRRRLAG